MYCSSCGTLVTPGLSYCNRCGIELAKEKPQSGTLVESLVWAIVAVAVAGVGINIGAMALMNQALHLDYPIILGFSLIFLFPFLSAEVVFIWLLLRSQRTPKLRQIIQQRAVATNELEAIQPRVLHAPATSVTEHTTHTLEPARVDRNTQ